MINSVNLNRINYAPAQFKKEPEPVSARKNPEFGSYYEENQSPFNKLKHTVTRLTDDVVGLVGFNAALWWLQNTINSKLLVGKINKHFTKGLPDNKLIDLAKKMLIEEEKSGKGLNNLDVAITNEPGEAYYSHVAHEDLPANRVRVGKDSISSLFHEIGHAKIENKSFLLKNMQRFRGHYTELSLVLYALLSGNKKENGKRHDWIIPLIAFSPELITEGMASKHGLNFLKTKIGKGIDKATYSKIKKSYITCFGTYLFVPLSIILLDAIRNSAIKERHKRKIAKEHTNKVQF